MDREQAVLTRLSGRRRLWTGGVVLAFLLATPLSGLVFGAASASAATTHAKPTKAQIAKTCTQVADALADGPDPDADPVGNVLAQVLPLRAIKTTDTALHTDITKLANAYENVYKTNDKKGTEAVVNKAGKQLDTICPGAF